MGFRRNRKDGLRVMRSIDDIRIRNIDTKLTQNKESTPDHYQYLNPLQRPGKKIFQDYAHLR